jgi:hypothetical protein
MEFLSDLPLTQRLPQLQKPNPAGGYRAIYSAIGHACRDGGARQ